jgi:protein-S-isoprenylcysteine O-methyltransferase Ste14
MLRRMLAQTLISIAILAAMLFVPAGTFDWPPGWALILLFVGCGQVTGLWLMRTDPELLAARMKSPLSRAQKGSDRAVMAAIFVVFCLWLIFMPLDARRFGWSHTPLWVQVLGAFLILVAYVGWGTVLKANSYASTEIRVQKERGQKVISDGPYAIVRHPMYAYVVPMMVGTSLLLGSLWGLLGVVLILPLLAARALGEEAMLFEGLPGYREYSEKVRFRLLPGLW